jgi:TPR repeat protein
MNEYEINLMMRLAEGGDIDARRDIIEYACNSADPDSVMRPDQLEQVREWMIALAEGDEGDGEDADVHVALLIGAKYYNGELGFPQDFTKAREWYEKAAEKGDSWALCNLGYVYAYGRDVEMDSEKALNYFMRSARMNNPNALYKIGDYYYNGEQQNPDYDAAHYFYRKAEHFAIENTVSEVYPNIEFRLGSCALHGHGVEKNPFEALERLHEAEKHLYREACEGHPFAEITLAKVKATLDEVREELDKIIERKEETTEVSPRLLLMGIV